MLKAIPLPCVAHRIGRAVARVANATTVPLPRSLNGTCGRLLADVQQLPGVERFQDGGGALGPQRYADMSVKMLSWHR